MLTSVTELCFRRELNGLLAVFMMEFDLDSEEEEIVTMLSAELKKITKEEIPKEKFDASRMSDNWFIENTR
jgi:hypothetical protein